MNLWLRWRKTSGYGNEAGSSSSLNVLLILLLVLSPAAILVQTVQSVPTVAVGVFPSSVTSGVGQNFSVNVAVSDVLDLYAWEFKLNWSAPMLNAIGVTEGPFLRTRGSTFFTYSVNATEGHMIVDCTLLGNVRGVNGSGTLATVVFNVKSAGQCPLDLYGVILLDSIELPIICLVTDSYWYSAASHDVAVTNVVALPTVVLQGEVVNVNVTVENHGGYAETFDVAAYANLQAFGFQSVTLGSGSQATFFFVWNTTGFAKGDYAISASASVVLGEVDIADNSNVASGAVTVICVGHDVAVVSVESSKTVVGQGFCMFIAVIVKNYGTFTEVFETFAYVNATVIHTQMLALESGKDARLAITWNTTGFGFGSYVLESFATPVSGEIDTVDNTLRDGCVAISVKCDISSVILNVPDGRVNMCDIAASARAFITIPGSYLWNGNADISGLMVGMPDNAVDMRDIAIVARYFGT